MNSNYHNVNYKIKCVINALNTFCSENAGSVENMTIEQIDSYIEDLQEAKRSLVKGKEQDCGITITETEPDSFRPTAFCAPVFCNCIGGCLESDGFLQDNKQKLPNGVQCQIKNNS